MDDTRVIRPAAVVPEQAARLILAELAAQDVGRGGVWNATAGVWQRYDRPWDGPDAGMGSARLVGTVAAAYGTPTKYEITIYRVTVTEHGIGIGWGVEALVDDALRHGELTLATCPRAALAAPPAPDPFRRRYAS